MRRREFLTLSTMGLGSAILPVVGADSGNSPTPKGEPTTSGKPGKKPNIVFILADDMGYGDIGAFNFGASETPAIDRLMREGTVLTQHYGGSAVCTPSRACLMTGRYPQRTGAIDTLAYRGLGNLALRERTMAEELASAGYATGLVGKWHLGWESPAYRPHARGFQEAAALEKTDHWKWVMDYNGVRKEHDGTYLADLLTDEAVGFIQRHKSEPFFLYLAHFAPHEPLEAPEEDIRPFLEAGLNEPLATLYGMIRRMDRGIGRVLEELDRLGLKDNTIVVFASDNGPTFGTSWTDRHAVTRYNCGFNGHKDLVYEGGIRVPAIIRWPAGIAGGRMIHDMTHFSDWLPTFMDIVGTSPSADMALDGQSMWPLLQGDSKIIAPRRFWQYSRYWPTAFHNAAVREGDWKLVRPCLDDVTGPVLGVLEPRGIAKPTYDWDTKSRYIPRLPAPLAPQLFNLRIDPQELHDLSSSEPERMQRMGNQLDAWFESVMSDFNSITKA